MHQMEEKHICNLNIGELEILVNWKTVILDFILPFMKLEIGKSSSDSPMNLLCLIDNRPIDLANNYETVLYNDNSFYQHVGQYASGAD
ncbi:hypothetical protein D3C87_1764060 [compost metagenome]